MDVGISKEEKATPVRVILRDEAKDIRVWFRLLWLHCQVESGICISCFLLVFGGLSFLLYG